MVVGVNPDQQDIDRLFRALADQTRRDIVGRTLDGERSVSALARHYPMSLAAVQKHVAVLERAKIVTKHRRGREQIVRANMSALDRARKALDQLEADWRQRIARIDSILGKPDNGETK